MKKEDSFWGILFGQYLKYKKLIWVYVAVCLFASLFAGPFVGSKTGGFVNAAEATVPIGETLGTLASTMVGPTLINLAGSYSEVVGISCEPFAALAFIGLVENVNRLVGKPLPIPDTPMGNPVVFLVVAIFFAISKIIKASPATKVIGDCTLGELEKYLGLVCILVMGVLNVIGVINTTNAAISNAADSANLTATIAPVLGVISAVITVLFSLFSVVVYFIIKTVSQGMDALAWQFSFIPIAPAICELLKTVITAFIIITNLVFPPLGIAINIIVFVICCFLFKRCFNAATFLTKIYIFPTLKRVKGYRPDIPLVSKRFLKKFKKVKTMEPERVDVAIPAYVTRYEGKNYKKFKPYTPGFLCHDEEGSSYMRRKGKKHLAFDIVSTDEKKVYIKNGFWCFEMFSYRNVPDLDKKFFPKKDLSILFSKEYEYRYEELLETFGCENFQVYKQEKKERKRAERRLKKELKKQGTEDASVEQSISQWNKIKKM